jgi:TolB-like protein/DNA-binding winged helix-turn-helix (wHTH) protein
MNPKDKAANEPAAARCWSFGHCEFDELRRTLRVRGVTAELEPKPIEVLHQLLMRAGQVVTKDEMLEAVWPETTVVDGSLATAVSKLRKALGDEESNILLTVPKVGYRLGVPVRTRAADAGTGEGAGAGDAVMPAPAGTDEIRGRDLVLGDAPGTAEATTHDGGERRIWWVAGVAALLLFVALGIYKRDLTLRQKAAATPQAMTSVAVLPFLNLSGDPAQEYLADGMTEELITELSRIRSLKVISRTSVMRYKGAKKTLPELARELHVEGVVEGAVLRSGNHVRVTATLIYAANDTHLWAQDYDRDLGDILSLQRELAGNIAREIKTTVSPAEERALANRAAVNPEAHDLYLKGRYFWNRRTREDLLKAQEYFYQATQVDPNGALGYAGLADTYVELVGFGNMDVAEGVPKAQSAATRAIALDGTLAEPHTALAYALAEDWDWGAAQKEFERAVELNPGYVTGIYQYAFFLSVMGKQEEAIPLARRAVELDPLSPIVLYRAGRVEYQARHYDEALVLFHRILELNASDALGLYGEGLVYEAQGKYDWAIAALEQQKLQQGLDVATAFAAAGKSAEARQRMAESVARLKQRGSYVRPGWVAEVYVALGDKDEAMRWLERAYKERDLWLALLKVWPQFDALRGDTRFQDLLRRMNFPN